MIKGRSGAVLLGWVGSVSGTLAVGSAAWAAAQSETEDRSRVAVPATAISVTTPGAAESVTIAAVRRGMVVRLSGEVIRVADRDEFRLSDGTGSIPVRLSWTGPAPVSAGDRVHVEGLVVDEMTFGLSRPEVLARSLRLPSGATVQFEAPQAAPDAAAPASQAVAAATVPIGRLARGQSATISGRVTGILDTDEFRVEDSSGSVRVYVGWQNRVGVRVGDVVTVVGMLDDEPWPIPAEFYADAITLADGVAINLRSRAPVGHASETGDASSTSTATDATPSVPSRIADIRPYDTVLLRGTVERLTDEDEFRLRDESGSIGVYIGWRNPMPVTVGEAVSVVGIVDAEGPAGLVREVYAHELTTGDGRRVDLQPRREGARPQAEAREPAHATPARAPAADATITPIRDVRRGQSVTLRGTVQRVRDTDEFVLRDDTGSITIYIGWRNRMPVAVGQLVTVIGTADDDVLPGLRPEIYASGVVLPDGRTVDLIRGSRDE